MCCLPLSVANSPSFSAFNPASSYKVHIIGEDRHDEGSRRHAIGEERHDEGPIDMPLVKIGMMRGLGVSSCRENRRNEIHLSQ